MLTTLAMLTTDLKPIPLYPIVSPPRCLFDEPLRHKASTSFCVNGFPLFPTTNPLLKLCIPNLEAPASSAFYINSISALVL